jgi:hypothetical protein
MAITINGSANTIAGLAVGGLPDGTVDEGTLATDAVTTAKVASTAITDAKIGGMASSKLSGALPAISGAALTGISGGLTGADQWRVTDNVAQGNDGDVTANWARLDDAGFIKIGTGLSESSGIFSFPDTGIWWIHWVLAAQPKDDTKVHMAGNFTSDNGSSWSETALATVGFNAGADDSGVNQGSASFLFDVTNTTNCKFKFTLTSVGGNSYGLTGASAYTYTGITALRLGDT